MQMERLGPYRIGRQLGRGGMGTVFEGLDERTGEPAAIKVLSIALSRDDAFRERFEAEIETLRKLRHENIVRLIGFGEEQGVLYYAMDLVQGISLEESVRAGKQLPWHEAVRIVVQVCHALRHAHDRGVIHRDIKPANLLLTPEGAVKLADFGIAKLFGSSGMTSAGGAIGTAEYMAPEQADGRLVSHRADLYSLGAVLYAMLAGRPPFVAKSVLEMLQMQRYAQPEPLRRYVPGLPEEIDSIVLQLLEKDPERRPANTTVLARRLEATSLGLSLREKKRESTDGEFDLGPATKIEQTGPIGNLGETRQATGMQSASVSAQLGQTTQVTSNLQPGGAAAPAVPAKPSTRFTSVGEDERDYEEPEERQLFRPRTLVLVFAILLTGLAVWYFLQPPNADSLYERIAENLREGGMEEGLLDAESDIESFLKYHPNDKRAKQIEDYLREITLLRKEREFRARLRMQFGVNGLSPPEIAYTQAMRDVGTDPDIGVEKLRALLALYEDDPAVVDKGRLAVRLARKQLQKYENIAARYVHDQQEHLTTRMERAENIAGSDLKRAREIWQAVIHLHHEKSWAQEHVRAAEQRLRATTEQAMAASNGDGPTPDDVAPPDDPTAPIGRDEVPAAAGGIPSANANGEGRPGR